MISAPQGDFKHTGHVGLDGAYFGDLSWMDGSKGNVSFPIDRFTFLSRFFFILKAFKSRKTGYIFLFFKKHYLTFIIWGKIGL